MHAVTRCGLDAHRRLGVEVAGAFTADHQVAVAVLTQPLDAVLGGDAAVHHHQGGARGVERIEHLGQCVMFAHVAGEDQRWANQVPRSYVLLRSYVSSASPELDLGIAIFQCGHGIHVIGRSDILRHIVVIRATSRHSAPGPEDV